MLFCWVKKRVKKERERGKEQRNKRKRVRRKEKERKRDAIAIANLSQRVSSRDADMQNADRYVF